MDEADFYYLDKVCVLLQITCNGNTPERLATEFGLSPKHTIKAGSRTFRLYDMKEVDEIAANIRSKNRPVSESERVANELSHEVSVIVAAVNSQRESMDKMKHTMAAISDSLTGVDRTMEALQKKIDLLCSELGLKNG